MASSSGQDIQMDQSPSHTLVQPQTQHQAHSPTPALGSSSKKRKEPDTQPVASGPSSSKKSRIIAPLPSRPKRPKKPSDYHLRKSDIKATDKNIKSALELHIRILWRLASQNAVPPTVTPDDRAAFNKRFNPSDATSSSALRVSVMSSLDDNSVNINAARNVVDNFLSNLPSSGTIASRIRRMAESDLLLMFRTVAAMGLRKWAPDLLGNGPGTAYNLLHEHIALVTFEQVLLSYGYSSLGVDASASGNHTLLRKLYRSFVFSYMHGNAKLEAKSPGALARDNTMKGVYSRRKELRKQRLNVLNDFMFNNRTRALVDSNDAHSDDEYCKDTVITEGTPRTEEYYKIKTVPFRSKKATAFFRMLSERNQESTLNKVGRRPNAIAFRTRKMPEEFIPSKFTKLPKSGPIDLFEPDEWNKLPIRIRIKYLEASGGAYVALPLPEYCDTWAKCGTWKDMSEKRFMRKYGNDVLLDYNLPTEKEIKRYQDGSPDMSEEDESSGSEDELGEVENATMRGPEDNILNEDEEFNNDSRVIGQEAPLNNGDEDMYANDSA
ncbi:hypothetical protein JR316_0012803 [Psilocybe cubensis]|uniref:Uncharacterized protein n=2 Tax=Psilocybe cubensis TaxID=181762 RepID=A0ACB8GFZ2_PSICU|nr:hypothetical protein JR316_0012803 [Psilocybe cubensis]KAH9474345.1 hypothetical protein JR316_0012803 [Psilocybe cubensis]